MTPSSPKPENLQRIDGMPGPDTMVSIRIDGYITASRGALSVNYKAISTTHGRWEHDPPGILVNKLDVIQCHQYGDEPPMIEWSEL